MGLPTREANVALGKLSPEKPIFMYPVPGSHIIDGLFFISRFYLSILDLYLSICEN